MSKPIEDAADIISEQKALIEELQAKLAAQAAPVVAASELSDERAAFEAWHTPLFGKPVRLGDSDQYHSYAGQGYWFAWQARAALAAAPAASVAVPAGYALVPIEPTPGMIDAYNITIDTGFAGSPAHGSHVWTAMIAAAPATPAAQAQQPAGVPAELARIGELLRTQDNRITDQPIFIVQQKRRVTGIDTDYCDNIVWLNAECEYEEASEEESARLESEWGHGTRSQGLGGWIRTGYADNWEFVTACFTEQGCKDYLRLDGHNLKETRIYAEGSYRNKEYRAVRDWLMSLPPAPGLMEAE